jgi:hypothetical protein
MYLKTQEDTIIGYIRSQSDSTLLFSEKRSLLHDLKLNQTEISMISYKDIGVIYVQEKRSVLKGIAYGVLTGCAVEPWSVQSPTSNHRQV